MAWSQTKSVSYDLDPSKLETRSAPMILGVGTHFGIGGEYGYDPVLSAQKIRELGFDSFRDDFSWEASQPSGPGDAVAPVDRLRVFMNLTNAQPLLILTGHHSRVDGGKAPLTGEARQHFAHFTSLAVRSTAKWRPMFEIWNEWNLTAERKEGFLKGEGDASDPRAAVHYAPLAKVATAAAKAVDPAAPVLIGADAIDADWGWITSVVRRGGDAGADGISVHLYNHCERLASDRSARQAIDALQALHDKLKAMNNREPRIYVTEVGWPTITGQGCVIDRKVAAQNFAQFILWSAAKPWVKGIWLYQLKDQGRDANELEHNFGLYDYDYRPKPAVCAVREAAALARGARGWRISRPNSDFFLAMADMPGGPRLIAWTSDESKRGKILLPDGRAASYSVLCSGVRANGGAIDVGAMPVVIDLAGLAEDSVRLELP